MPVPVPKPYDRAREDYSDLQRLRLKSKLTLPKVLESPTKENVKSEKKIHETIQKLFPKTWNLPAVEFVNEFSNNSGTVKKHQEKSQEKSFNLGVVLSGGQAPGGHNVICGIYDQAKNLYDPSFVNVYGFLDGPHGIFTGNYVLLNDEIVDGFRNTGGFDMLGSGRHKIETPEEMQDSLYHCSTVLSLDGLIVIGGDDSNTNAALLAEYFKGQGVKTKVVGCPKTIDGDLKVLGCIPISFGFDTACRTYSELVGNVSVDALSSQKYYHFVRLMGRSASNIALEVALQTQINICLIGEEVKLKKQSLKKIVKDITKIIITRYNQNGQKYGVVLLPEGLIEFIPEIQILIQEINEILALIQEDDHDVFDFVISKLSETTKETFLYLPEFMQQQLLLDRDPHGNVQVAKIETERLLAKLILKELINHEDNLKKKTISCIFQPQFHAFGYEGRAGLPTLFDSNYSYALGATATTLISKNCTGMIASVRNLENPIEDWYCGGVPVTSLCRIERRKGKDKAVIEKALVELDGKPFKTWEKYRDFFSLNDYYRIPGPIQYEKGTPDYGKNGLPITLQLELGLDYQYNIHNRGLDYQYNIHNTSNNYNNTTNNTTKNATNNTTSQEEMVDTDTKSKTPLVSRLEDSIPVEDSILLEYKDVIVDFPEKGCQFRHWIKRSPSLFQKWITENYDKILNPHPIENYIISKEDILSALPPARAIKPQDEILIKAKFPKLSKESNRRPIILGTNIKNTIHETNASCVNKTIGIVLCGRPTPGVNDCIEGIVKNVKKVIGFIGGTKGFYQKQYCILDKKNSGHFLGGFVSLGRTADNFTDYKKIKEICIDLKIDGLILIGGTRTSTHAAGLTEYLLQDQEQNHQQNHEENHQQNHQQNHEQNDEPNDESNDESNELNPSNKTIENNSNRKDSNRNICIISIPASMGGSFCNSFIEQPLGFDSVCKSTSKLVGNTAIDGNSARKYYYFLRVMEDDALDSDGGSHVTIETALQTKPNYILIGEEISNNRFTLNEIIKKIADIIQKRKKIKKNFGTILIPDSILFNIMEFRMLIDELDNIQTDFLQESNHNHHNNHHDNHHDNHHLNKEELNSVGVNLLEQNSYNTSTSTSTTTTGTSNGTSSNGTCSTTSTTSTRASSKSSTVDNRQFYSYSTKSNEFHNERDDINDNWAKESGEEEEFEKIKEELSPWSKALLESLPKFVRKQLLQARFVRGMNKVNLADIETEKLISEMVATELKRRNHTGFSPVCQFLGYQSRCCVPSRFDAQYGFALGYVAVQLINANLSGYTACISNLNKSLDKWEGSGIPFFALLEKSYHQSSYQSYQKIDKNKHSDSLLSECSNEDFVIKVAPKSSESFLKEDWCKWALIQEQCALKEIYRNPGPTQLIGPCSFSITEKLKSRNPKIDIVDSSKIQNSFDSFEAIPPVTSNGIVDSLSYNEQLKLLKRNLDKIENQCRPGCEPKRLKLAVGAVGNALEMLESL